MDRTECIENFGQVVSDANAVELDEKGADARIGVCSAASLVQLRLLRSQLRRLHVINFHACQSPALRVNNPAILSRTTARYFLERGLNMVSNRIDMIKLASRNICDGDDVTFRGFADLEGTDHDDIVSVQGTTISETWESSFDAEGKHVLTFEDPPQRSLFDTPAPLATPWPLPQNTPLPLRRLGTPLDPQKSLDPFLESVPDDLTVQARGKEPDSRRKGMEWEIASFTTARSAMTGNTFHTALSALSSTRRSTQWLSRVSAHREDVLTE